MALESPLINRLPVLASLHGRVVNLSLPKSVSHSCPPLLANHMTPVPVQLGQFDAVAAVRMVISCLR